MNKIEERIMEKINISAIRGILEKEKNILFAYLYGSFSKSVERKDSDIDIGIFVKDLSDMEKYYPEKLALKIERMIGGEIDIRILNDRDIIFLHQVLKYGKLLFSKNEKKRIKFETDVYKKYIDFVYYMEEYDRIRRRRILA